MDSIFLSNVAIIQTRKIYTVSYASPCFHSNFGIDQSLLVKFPGDKNIPCEFQHIISIFIRISCSNLIDRMNFFNSGVHHIANNSILGYLLFDFRSIRTDMDSKKNNQNRNKIL